MDRDNSALPHAQQGGVPVDLLYALNNIATAVQQSIRHEDAIYAVFRKQVISIGLRGGISLLDGDGEILRFKAIAFTGALQKVLREFEERLGLQAEGYAIPVERVDAYRRVIKGRETVFFEDTSVISAAIVPTGIRSLVSPILSFLGAPPGIYSPLIFGGQVRGMLNIVGRTITPGDIPAVRALSGHIAVALENAGLVQRLVLAREELETAYQSTLEGWVQALDLRDQTTEGHTVRVANAAVLLAQRLGVPEADLPHIRRGALLHDIGKMAIPDSILRKPGPLTPDEAAIMRQHPVRAYEWLSRIEYLRPAADIPYCHHERWDGSGYPRGLQGEEIPMAARIFAVVDVWDAMTSDRPYRKRLDQTETARFLKSQAGQLFDERAVRLWLELPAGDRNRPPVWVPTPRAPDAG